MKTSVLHLLIVAVLLLLPMAHYGQTNFLSNTPEGFASSTMGIITQAGFSAHAWDLTAGASGKSIDVKETIAVAMLTKDNPKVSAISASGNSVEVAAFYPNPFTRVLAIDIPEEWLKNKSELRIYTLLGAEVMNTSLVKQFTTLETGNLPSGLYFYKIICNNKAVQTGRLVSQQ